MKVRKIILILFFGLTISPFIANAQFTRTLKLGMSGDDVRRLQIVLNRDPLTKVAISGTGSSGQESSYFGNLTQKAVIRFQEKYSDRILKPNGLSFGTGFVGKSTLEVLNDLITIPSTPIVSTSTTSNVSSNTNSTNQLPQTNPNQKNLDVFLNAVEKVSKNKGLLPENISKIKDQIVKDVATTTDLMKTFLGIVEKNKKQTKINQNKNIAIKDLLYFIEPLFPKKALAGTGIPFGGAVLFSYFCNCSGNWLITLEPLPPSFAVLLSYNIGSQAYLSYNIPFTPWLLGEYQFGGQCSTYIGTGCANIPSEGLITPLVGSAL